MEDITSVINLSEIQYILVSLFHQLFIPLMLGLGFIVAIMETIYFFRKKEIYLKSSKFWSGIFTIGIISGIISFVLMAFQTGMNASNYVYILSGIIDFPLFVAGTVLLVLLSASTILMYCGWDKVGKLAHLISTWMAVIAANLIAFCVIVICAWNEYPTGAVINVDSATIELMDILEAISIVAISKYLHTALASFIVAALFVIGVSSYFILKNYNIDLANCSIKISLYFGLFSLIAIIFSGYFTSQVVAVSEPMKFAAMSNLKYGSNNVKLGALPAVSMSKLGYGDKDAYVPGVNDMKEGNIRHKVVPFETRRTLANQALGDFMDTHEAIYKNHTKKIHDKIVLTRNKRYFKSFVSVIGYGFLTDSSEQVPPMTLVNIAFTLMLFSGMWMMVFVLVFGIIKFRKKNNLVCRQWLYVSMATAFIGYLAFECGWVVSEVGKLPWLIEGIMPSSIAFAKSTDAVSIVMFVIFVLLYIVLLAESTYHIAKKINCEKPACVVE